MRRSRRPSICRAIVAVLMPALVYYAVVVAAMMWIVMAELSFALWDMSRTGKSDATFMAVAIALGGIGAILLATRLERWVFGVPLPRSGLRPAHTRAGVAVLTLVVTLVGPYGIREYQFQKYMYLAEARGTEEERAEALHTLGLIGNPRALPRLRESLWFEGREGESAAGALAKVPGGEEVLLEVIRDTPEFSPIWTKAALSLRDVYETEERARSVVRKVALEHPDPAIRREVIRNFPSRPDADQAEVLGAAMRDEDGWVRWEAISRAGYRNVSFASRLAAAESLLREPDPELRRRGVWTLGGALRPEPNEELVRALRERLGDEDAGVRMAAVHNLQKHDPVDALRTAMSVALDRTAPLETRTSAILFLRDVAEERINPFLRQLSQDESAPAQVRERALAILKVREGER